VNKTIALVNSSPSTKQSCQINRETEAKWNQGPWPSVKTLVGLPISGGASAPTSECATCPSDVLNCWYMRLNMATPTFKFFQSLAPYELSTRNDSSLAYVCSCGCVGRPWTAADRDVVWLTRLSSYVEPLCV